ncbi:MULTISPECIES: hypothetical protein [Priestia]|nr:hypothetical protein [Priestia aryabhattai]MBX9994351.1 hypothetical protein [Priestia aryabhattai]
MKKLLIGTALLSLSLTMGACDSYKRENDLLEKKSVAEAPKKKSEGKDLDKKSESQQIQNEQKDLRGYSVKVEKEKKAKELAEQKAREEAEVAEQQKQQKIAGKQPAVAQQEEQNKQEESPVSQETIDNYEANQAETWAEEAEIEAELNAEAAQEDTQSEEYYRKRAEEERASLKEGETPKWTSDPWVDSQTEWAEMTPEEQKQWQEDNLGDLNEDIQYDDNGEIIE